LHIAPIYELVRSCCIYWATFILSESGVQGIRLISHRNVGLGSQTDGRINKCTQYCLIYPDRPPLLQKTVVTCDLGVLSSLITYLLFFKDGLPILIRRVRRRRGRNAHGIHSVETKI